jgi:hypothetical protein
LNVKISSIEKFNLKIAFSISDIFYDSVASVMVTYIPGEPSSHDGRTMFLLVTYYSASHSRVAPENVGLQKEQEYNTLACHTRNEV